MTIFPGHVAAALARIASRRGEQFYLTGGAVRDLLAGGKSRDLDILCRDPFPCAEDLARLLHAAFVPLDRENGVARVVAGPVTVDFSAFRGVPGDLEDDLRRRDFTINAMAIPLPLAGSERAPENLVDPTGGREDLAKGIVRVVSEQAFVDDPLRMVRAYRFAALFDFRLDAATERLIIRDQELISRTAAERIRYEFDLIMDSPRSALAAERMAASGLLWRIFPELALGRDVLQPSSHHLDVWGHSLEALRQAEFFHIDPNRFFADRAGVVTSYLGQGHRSRLLKWAALFHDLGKPATRDSSGDRITFHNHDRRGVDLFLPLARKNKWSRDDMQTVALLIGEHMRPFHLANVRRRDGKISARACLRLVRIIGDELIGLFCLAMADSLAGQGPGKPANMEDELLDLFREVMEGYDKHLAIMLKEPPLLNGHDLQHEFGLAPGPLLKTILMQLQEAQAEGEVAGRPAALAFVREFLAGCDEAGQNSI